MWRGGARADLFIPAPRTSSRRRRLAFLYILSMQIKTFTIPALSESNQTDDLNRFLRANRVLEIKKEFVNGDNGAFWAICVTYLPMTVEGGASVSSYSSTGHREKVDYRNVLSDTDFLRFSLLRKIRKLLAENDAVPPFAVFTDAELAEIAKLEVPTPQAIKKINGIGNKKVEKYGTELCRLFGEQQKTASDETDRTPDGENLGF